MNRNRTDNNNDNSDNNGVRKKNAYAQNILLSFIVFSATADPYALQPW